MCDYLSLYKTNNIKGFTKAWSLMLMITYMANFVKKAACYGYIVV